MRGSDIIFDRVNLLHYKCRNINLKQDGSYIDSPDWIKNKKVRKNPINDDDKCFQFTATVTLNLEEIGKKLQIISKCKLFVSKCNWIGINYPLRKDDRKKFRKINPKIAVNVLYVKEIKKLFCLNFKTQVKL